MRVVLPAALLLTFTSLALVPAQSPQGEYVKKATRAETVRATLASFGLPNLEGKWYSVGPFDNTDRQAFDTVYPPEKAVDLKATYAGKPPVRAVAGTGEIVKWERLPTGRYNILVKGEARVRIEGEHPSDTLYRVVVGRRLDDVAPTKEVSGARERIRSGCRRLLSLLKRSPDLLDGAVGDDQPPGVVADRVAAAVIPEALAGRDLIVQAQTGSGKTLAFALPILDHLRRSPSFLQRHRSARAGRRRAAGTRPKARPRPGTAI